MLTYPNLKPIQAVKDTSKKRIYLKRFDSSDQNFKELKEIALAEPDKFNFKEIWSIELGYPNYNMLETLKIVF